MCKSYVGCANHLWTVEGSQTLAFRILSVNFSIFCSPSPDPSVSAWPGSAGFTEAPLGPGRGLQRAPRERLRRRGADVGGAQRAAHPSEGGDGKRSLEKQGKEDPQFARMK